MSIKREQCPTCKRTIARKLNGEFYSHAMSAGTFAKYAYHHGRCPMSNRSPDLPTVNAMIDAIGEPGVNCRR